MQEQKNNIDNDLQPDKVNSGIDATGTILTTALKTLLWTIVFAALFATLFVTLFPLKAMYISSDLGLKERSFSFGERYIASTKADYVNTVPAFESDFMRGLNYTVNLNVEIFDDYTDKPYKDINLIQSEYYADKLIKYTSYYASFSSSMQRNQAIDKYALNNTIPARHVNVYSNADSLEIANYRAQVLNKELTSILRGNKTDDLRTLANTMSGLELNASNIDSYINVFNQLTAYIDFELNRLGIYNEENMSENGIIGSTVFPLTDDYFTLFYTRSNGATQYIKDFELITPRFKDFVLGYEALTREDSLRQLYWTRALARFTDRMWSMAMLLYKNIPQYLKFEEDVRARHFTWQKMMSIDKPVGGTSGGTVSDYYYGVMIGEYVKLF